MPAFKDLTGQRFGKLTVLERDSDPEKKGKGTYWMCQCDCGRVVSVNRDHLCAGDTKSCGCLKHRTGKDNSKFLDLTGQRFGHWTVLGRDLSPDKKEKGTYWRCKCDCGTIKSVWGGSLKNGSSKSCGCLNHKKGQDNPNFIDLTGRRFDMLTVRCVDKEKTEEMHKTYWMCDCDCGGKVSVAACSLMGGVTKSCGCLNHKKGQDNPNFIDLTGRRFGMLTVLCIDEERTEKTGRTIWLCECDCGKIVSIYGSNLRIGGHTTSCGCQHYKTGEDSPNFIDLTGRRFDMLTVRCVDKEKTKEMHKTYWMCDCDCGGKVSVAACNLTGGHTKSCGCTSKTKSFGESYIEEYLQEKGLVAGDDYCRQATFNDLRGETGGKLSYDFEILHPFHIFIEYQGKQHYVPVEYFGGDDKLKIQQEHDRIKAEYARERGVPLFYVLYEDDTYEKVSETMDKIFKTAKAE